MIKSCINANSYCIKLYVETVYNFMCKHKNEMPITNIKFEDKIAQEYKSDLQRSLI